MAVLFLSHAEEGVSDEAVATSVWDHTVSGNSPLSQLYYRDATPVPGSGRSKYFQHDVDGDNGTSTSVGTNTLTDTGKSWTAGRWSPQPDKDWNLIDSAGTKFDIASHTSNTITVRSGNPASGAYRIVGQHDAYNEKTVTSIPLTPGVTYYLGLFVRFDRINSVGIWDDTPAELAADEASSDKLFEANGNTRILIMSGIPDWTDQCRAGSVCENKLTFGIYLSVSTCTGCMYDQVEANVSPYDRDNVPLFETEKWLAVVQGFTPSTGGSNEDGRLEMWVNGIKTSDYPNVKTQDTASPAVDVFRHNGTIAQPQYDAPAHIRKYDYFIFADDLQDIIDAGLMEDPEASGTAYSLECSPGRYTY